MQLPPQLQSKLETFAKSKSLSTDDAVAFIIEAYLREHPVPAADDNGLAPDELNASNDG
jgi:hypothetical protein